MDGQKVNVVAREKNGACLLKDSMGPCGKGHLLSAVTQIFAEATLNIAQFY